MGSAKPKILPPLVGQFCNDLWLVDGLSERTIDAYQADLLGFDTWLAKHNGKSLSETLICDIEGWLVSLRERNVSARSVARYISALRRFFNYLMTNGLASHNPTAGLCQPKLPVKLPNTPTEAEVTALLDIADLNSHRGLRDKAMLEMLYATGLRATELVGLQIGDIDFRSRVIRVCGKGTRNGWCCLAKRLHSGSIFTCAEPGQP